MEQKKHEQKNESKQEKQEHKEQKHAPEHTPDTTPPTPDNINTPDLVNELTNTVKRVQAEFENYKKRVLRDQDASQKHAVASFIKKIIPIIDTFELALKHTDNHNDFVTGMTLVHEQLNAVLKQAGVEKIQKNIPYNPELHHALLAEESDQPEHTVLGEILPGYMLYGMVLRPAQVTVAKKRAQKNEKKQ